MTDCLIIGFNDPDFEEYEKLIRAMGPKNGAYRDLTWGFVDFEGKPYRCLDLLTRFYYEGKQKPASPFHNADYVWIVVLYLASYLAKHGLSYDYVNLFHFGKEELKKKLLSQDIRTIAITTTLYVAPHPILEIISFIRQYNTTAKILVGGPYISGQSKMLDQSGLEDQFKYLGADIYVIGSEGEAALVNIIRALKEGSDLSGVENIAYKSDGRFKFTPASTEYNPLEENMVQYSLFKEDHLGEFLTTRTAKSCPFACSFCGFPERAGAYKYLSVELVEQELNAIAELGTVTTLSFIDDTFNVPKGRFKDMLRMMIRNKYPFKWNCYYRSDHGDSETIELMAQAGCEGVLLGVESGSDYILKIMNKSARRKDYMRAIPHLQSVGISCYASLIIGFPGETFETVQETMSLVEETKPDFFRPQIWYCDPITPIYKEKEKYGIKGNGFSWRHDTMDVDTACDLIERCFLSVQNSVWLPEHGFEQWSTFYLMRKGMTMQQIKDYVTCYNTAIKEKLLCPDRKLIDPKILAATKATAQFDVPSEVSIEPIDALSGNHYLAAEKFWIGEFTTNPPRAALSIGREEDEWASAMSFVPALTVESVETKCELSIEDIILSAFSVLLSRLCGMEDSAIIAVNDHPNPARAVLPLRLQPAWSRSFKSFAESVREKRLEASEHQPYAISILSNPIRMGLFEATPPVFDVGYAFGREHDSRSDCFEAYPHLADSVKLLLTASRQAEGLQVNVGGCFSEATCRTLADYMASLLREVSESPEMRLIDIPIESAAAKSASAAGEKYVMDTFEF